MSKRGLADAGPFFTHEQWAALNLNHRTWFVNWRTHRIPKHINGLHVPMLWADAERGIELGTYDYQLQAEIDLPVGYDGWLVVTNEPDRPDQASMSPQRVIDLMLWCIDRWPDIRLVAPNIGSDDVLKGFPWLTEFCELIADHPYRDALMWHWARVGFHHYNQDGIGPKTPSWHLDQIDALMWSRLFDNKGAWVTELGSRNAPDYMLGYMDACEADERIKRYFAFGTILPRKPHLAFMQEFDEVLTSYGQVFAGTYPR